MEIFESRKDVDFSFSWYDRARIRGNAFYQKGDIAIALRMIPSKIPSFEQLGLPDGGESPGSAAPGLRSRHRTYWIGKVDHARLDHRSHQ